MTLWTSKIATVAKLYSSLDSDFLTHINDIIDTNGPGSSLFRLLRVEEPSDALGELLKVLLSKYNPHRYCFEINGHSLNVTLEDVLYLTWLPIQGDPVIPLKSRDLGAFETLFGIHEKQVSIDNLISIANDRARAKEVRERAVLLIIVNCMICPNQNGQICNTTFAQFLSPQGNSVDSYAWGAAMLSYLYFGISKKVQNSKKSMDGNIWLILSFFLLRIPKLQDLLHIELKPSEGPLLFSMVKAVLPISKNRKPKYKNDIQCTLENLSDGDIVWRPYLEENMRMSLPVSLRSQVKFGTLVAPLFCIEKVVHHRPNAVPKQFEVFDEFMVDSLDHVFHEINQKHNRGPGEIDFKGFYAKEIKMWESQKLAEDHMIRRGTDQGDQGDQGSFSRSSTAPFHEEEADQRTPLSVLKPDERFPDDVDHVVAGEDRAEQPKADDEQQVSGYLEESERNSNEHPFTPPFMAGSSSAIVLSSSVSALNLEERHKSDSPTTNFEGFDIRSDLVPTLQKIWQKHGNIIKDRTERNRDIVARALESLGTMVRILEENPAQSLSDVQANYLSSTLSDLKRMHFKVCWLFLFVEKALIVHKSKPLVESLDNLNQLNSEVEEDKVILLDKLAKLYEKQSKLKEEIVKVSKMIPFSGQVKFDKPIGAGLT